MTGTYRVLIRQEAGVVCALLLTLFPLSGLASAQEAAQPAAQLLTPDQLDDLVAPIALYPDPLLSQVLVASTYPLEVVEASQWLQQNRNLSGQQLVDAARRQNWDPSVQALVAFPDVLNRLASDVTWTTDLGNAFLAQQDDVMNAVQNMRAQARASGRLYSTPQQTVETQTQNGRTVIEIVPANPQVIYVPVYNPEYIWGPPVWGYYPPLYYPAVGFGFGFGNGIYIGAFFGGWGWGGWGGWGWAPNWFNCSIGLNFGFFNHYGFREYYRGGYGFRGGYGVWTHDPYHRLGAPYPNRALASRFRGNYVGPRGNVHGYNGTRVGAFGGGGRYQGSVRSFGPQGNRGAVSPRVQANARSFGSQGNRATAGGWNRFGGSRAQSAQGFRSTPANRGGGFRSFNSSPSYGRSAPAYRPSSNFGRGGVRSAPSFNGRSFGASRGSFGGGRSAPSFSGGRSFGGSRPSFSGGGRGFGGGGSRSFGGSRGGGGSHGGGGGRGGRR